jgi:peptidyl-tRNA hydrolase, PTH1 family
MKVIVGLGNPGAEYISTRHNVGWWLLDRLHQEWRFDKFRRDGNAVAAEGRVEGHDVLMVKPTTYMNRSGAAVARLLLEPEFNPSRDLLVLVDDVALPCGKARLRPSGSAGGHNGLKSIEASLRSQEYARLRIGVGEKPPGFDLADWVLGTFEAEEEDAVRELFPTLVDTVATWIRADTDEAVRRLSTGKPKT